MTNLYLREVIDNAVENGKLNCNEFKLGML